MSLIDRCNTFGEFAALVSLESSTNRNIAYGKQDCFGNKYAILSNQEKVSLNALFSKFQLLVQKQTTFTESINEERANAIKCLNTLNNQASHTTNCLFRIIHAIIDLIKALFCCNTTDPFAEILNIEINRVAPLRTNRPTATTSTSASVPTDTINPPITPVEPSTTFTFVPVTSFPSVTTIQPAPIAAIVHAENVSPNPITSVTPSEIVAATPITTLPPVIATKIRFFTSIREWMNDPFTEHVAVQIKIISFLTFPEIARARGTCRGFNKKIIKYLEHLPPLIDIAKITHSTHSYPMFTHRINGMSQGHYAFRLIHATDRNVIMQRQWTHNQKTCILEFAEDFSHFSTKPSSISNSFVYTKNDIAFFSGYSSCELLHVASGESSVEFIDNTNDNRDSVVEACFLELQKRLTLKNFKTEVSPWNFKFSITSWELRHHNNLVMSLRHDMTRPAAHSYQDKVFIAANAILCVITCCPPNCIEIDLSRQLQKIRSICAGSTGIFVNGLAPSASYPASLVRRRSIDAVEEQIEDRIVHIPWARKT